jgi:hypothetical protein
MPPSRPVAVAARLVAMVERRSRAEWLKLVAAYRASREPLERFAARRGVQPRTLKWWAWKLGPGEQDGVRVLPVVVRDDDPVATRETRHARDSGAAGFMELAVADVRLRFELGADAGYVAALVAELRARC